MKKHVVPDENNINSCDECPFKCKKGEALLKHFREKHKTDTQNTTTVSPRIEEDKDELSRTKEELRVLKNNFQRLEAHFQDSLEEVNKVKSEYEAKLIEANDKFRQVKAENEELREKVDVLFKLGRSYINKKEKTQQDENNEKKKDVPVTDDVEEIQTISVEEVTVDDLQTWTQNRLRGFKRVSPSSNSAPKHKPATNSSTTNRQPQTSASPATPASEGSSGSGSARESSAWGPSTGSERKQYCHYFVNKGKYNYEEKCRFAHEQAPMCRSGLACNRSKCMYSHPNIGGTGIMAFLDVTRCPQLMMNPWMSQNLIQQLPNPWMMNGNQGRN